MTPLLWEAEIFGDDSLIQGLIELENSMSSFKIPLMESATRAAASVDENIERDLTPFAPLAVSTLYRTAAYRMGGPLFRYGTLLRAATDLTGTIAGSGFAIDDESVFVGLDDTTDLGKIGVWLTRGHPAGETNDHKYPALPPRPFMRLLNSDVEFIGERFGDYVDKSCAKAFATRRF